MAMFTGEVPLPDDYMGGGGGGGGGGRGGGVYISFANELLWNQ